MKFMNKLERKFGRFAIHNLTLFLIGAYVIGYVFQFLNADMMTYLTLNPYSILHGQVWRIVTWVLVPPEQFDIFTIIMLLFYYSLGTSLEREWGAFRYNFYIIGGMLLTVAGAFVMYGIYEWLVIPDMESAVAYFLDHYMGIEVSAAQAKSFAASAVEAGNASGVIKTIYYNLFAGFSTYYINLSIFLAFAASYPDMQVMLYFVIPLKIKWLAYLDVVYLIYQVYSACRIGEWGIVVTIIISLLNFIIFFLMTRNYRRVSPKEVHRRNVYKKQVHQAQQRVTTHRCAICGRTDEDETLEFRFCSKCNGNYEYCQHHLFTHTHVQ